MNELLLITTGVSIGVIIIGLIAFLHINAVNNMTINLLRAEIDDLKDKNEKALKNSSTTQRAVIKGQIAEQLFPLSVDCTYFPSDMKFMGMPIDYIIFDGYTDTKDGDGEIREVIFADIKTGNAVLNKTQRSIKRAVEEGRVRWETIHL